MVVLTVSSDALIHVNGLSYRCAFGRNGIQRKKHEGDGITPTGCYPLRRLLFRPDRLDSPLTNLPAYKIRPYDGWCDDPHDFAYNQPVELPYKASAEHMWRRDRLYDLVVVLGFNDDPVVPDAGSAIFLHVASADYSPTEGCIAVSFQDLLSLLPILDTDSEIKLNL